jgi:hypothetical protein
LSTDPHQRRKRLKLAPMTGLRDAFNRYRAMNLRLDMQRGQPSDENLALARDLFTIVGPAERAWLCRQPEPTLYSNLGHHHTR